MGKSKIYEEKTVNLWWRYGTLIALCGVDVVLGDCEIYKAYGTVSCVYVPSAGILTLLSHHLSLDYVCFVMNDLVSRRT